MINTSKFVTPTLVAATLTLLISGCRSKSTGDDEVAYTRTPNYKYSELIIKDYDEMTNMVHALIRKAQSAGGEGPAVEYLQNALKLTFSRPDSDNMVAKLTSEVRRELNGYNAFEHVIAQLAAEASDNLRDKENTLSVRTTSSFILENLMAEIKPEAERTNGDMRKTLQRIADSDLELARDVRSERTLRGMYRSPNPNEEAQRILKTIADHERAEKKQRDQEAERLRKEKKSKSK